MKFKLPDKNPDGGDWVDGQIVQIALFVKGRNTNQLPLKIALPLTIGPLMKQLAPTAGPAGTLVTVTGTAFGPTRDELTLDNFIVEASAISSWSNEEIKFAIPPRHPNGNAWTANQKVSIAATVQKRPSNKLEFMVS